MNTIHSTALLAAVALATFAAAPRVHAQANLTFAGAYNEPIELTLSEPVIYDVTTASSGVPLFVFQNVGNIYVDEFVIVTGTITFSVDGGPAQTINMANSGYIGGSVAATDAYIYGQSLITLNVGDTVVLNSGTLSEYQNYGVVPPAGGSFQTFITDTNLRKLDAVNGIAVPEPSTWTLLLAGASLLGLMLKRRAALPARAGASSVATECSRPAAARCCSPL